MKLDSQEKIITWLESMEIKDYHINIDLSVDVAGDVFLANKGLREIPVQFGRVQGGFYIFQNQLLSLRGSPREVQADFIASQNLLITLEGGPLKVEGNYDVGVNQLISLKGAPTFEVNEFVANHNQLSSLEFLPPVKEHLDVEFNRLSNLIGCPEKLFHLNCSNNQLTSLEGAPKIIQERLLCYNNNLTNLHYAPKMSSELSHFDCSNNLLSTAVGAPENVYEFVARHNQLMDFQGIPQSAILALDFNRIRNFDFCPSIRYELHLSGNQIDNLNHCPPHLRVLDLEDNPVTDIQGLPKNTYKLILPKIDNLDWELLSQAHIAILLLSEKTGDIQFVRERFTMDKITEIAHRIKMKEQFDKVLPIQQNRKIGRKI